MSHRNARLTVHGRRLIVRRVRDDGMPVAHVAKAMGVSRQCAHRWLNRYDAEGDAGLQDRSSRPHRMPTKTAPEVELVVLDARRQHRRGQDWLGPELRVPARTVSRILRRHDVPRLASCDPLTGEVIRASKTTAVRYERDRAGELVHMDVSQLQPDAATPAVLSSTGCHEPISARLVGSGPSPTGPRSAHAPTRQREKRRNASQNGCPGRMIVIRAQRD